MLHCFALFCSVLQFDAMCCSLMLCVAVEGGEGRAVCILKCVAVCCSVLQCVAVCCSVLPCVELHCSVLQSAAGRLMISNYKT